MFSFLRRQAGHLASCVCLLVFGPVELLGYASIAVVRALIAIALPDMHARTTRIQKAIADCVRLAFEHQAIHDPTHPRLAKWTGGLALSGHSADTLVATEFLSEKDLPPIPTIARQQIAAICAAEAQSLGPWRWRLWCHIHQGRRWISTAPRTSSHAYLLLHARVAAHCAQAAPRRTGRTPTRWMAMLR